MRDVITFGSATLDIFAESAKERTLRICSGDVCEEIIMYPSGEKVILSELHTDVGGGGTNTAAALRELGLRVAFGGAVGTDRTGDDILSYLGRNGIEFLGARVPEQTNTSIVLDSKQLHDRTILVYKSSSDMLRTADLDLSALEATWFYFSSLLGESYATMLDLMRLQRGRGGAVAFNPSNYQASQGLDALREPIALSQLLVLNREEAALLVGEGTKEELAKRLRREGAEIVLVTDGSDGAALLHGGTLYTGRPEPTDVVETTGAGDCFAATFLAGLITGLSPADALRLAFINVESLITKVGAKQGLLGAEEAMRRLAADTRGIDQQNI